MRLIDADALWCDIQILPHNGDMISGEEVEQAIADAPAIDAVPVSEIKDYLQKRLDEWEALGDRKFEPANMWGYNFIMACFDDLERRDGE